MRVIDDFPCDLEHPLFEIIDNQTRRHIIRLLALEHNYGNQLASIVNFSAPAIHKHIKKLEGHSNDHGDVSIISNKYDTFETFSGRKGGKASIYEVDNHLGLFFGIFPNYIHSQVTEMDNEGRIIDREIDPRDFDPNLFGTEITLPDSDKESQDEFEEKIDLVKSINNEITNFQNRLITLLFEKDQLIHKIYEKIEGSDNLTFTERIVLKSLVTYGTNNLRLIASLLNKKEEEIYEAIRRLKEKNWIKDHQIHSIKT